MTKCEPPSRRARAPTTSHSFDAGSRERRSLPDHSTIEQTSNTPDALPLGVSSPVGTAVGVVSVTDVYCTTVGKGKDGRIVLVSRQNNIGIPTYSRQVRGFQTRKVKDIASRAYGMK